MTNQKTFLMVKRGVVQYIVIRPIIGILIVIFKLLGKYEDGYIAMNSAYLWISLIYNISVCVALYFLFLFYFQCKADLQPYRPFPKFLCVKALVFFAFWQGFFIGILVAIGVIPSDTENTSTALHIQDTLLCLEMPLFAWMHYYAFPWTDYVDSRLSSRMLIYYAIRDALGVKDIIYDAKETFSNIFYSSYSFVEYQDGETEPIIIDSRPRYNSVITFEINAEEEEDYTHSRTLVFGDYLYPVVHLDFINPPQVQTVVDRYQSILEQHHSDSFKHINEPRPPLKWDD